MGQWVKALAAKSDDRSSIPIAHIVEGEDRRPQLPFDVHSKLLHSHHTHISELCKQINKQKWI